jgi:hypothetical protein
MRKHFSKQLNEEVILLDRSDPIPTNRTIGWYLPVELKIIKELNIKGEALRILHSFKKAFGGRIYKEVANG